MSSQQKENLEIFVAHCKQLGAEDDPSGDGYTREFRELRETQATEKKDKKYPAEAGKTNCSIRKNRYKDIVPYDYKRVILKGEVEDGTDYINASYIQDANGHNGYIASQGPLPHTVNDFWRMLWELKIEIVFMVCKLQEGIPPKKKCEKYWVDDEEEKDFGDITVKLVDEKELVEDFYCRHLTATCGSETHSVTQFQYSGWPDHDIPDDADVLNIMIHHMRLERTKPDIPLVIHCSAGCGRTGSICAIDYAWTLLNQNKIDKNFSLYEIIKRFREQRQSMVQTPDQYQLVHNVMYNLFEKWLENYEINNAAPVMNSLYTNITFDTVYENVGNDDNVYTNVSDEDYSDVGTTDGAAVVVFPAEKEDYSNVSVISTKDSSGTHKVTNERSSVGSVSSVDNDQLQSGVYAMASTSQKGKAPEKVEKEGMVKTENSMPSLPPRNYALEEINPKVQQPSRQVQPLPEQPKEQSNMYSTVSEVGQSTDQSRLPTQDHHQHIQQYPVPVPKQRHHQQQHQQQQQQQQQLQQQHHQQQQYRQQLQQQRQHPQQQLQHHQQQQLQHHQQHHQQQQLQQQQLQQQRHQQQHHQQQHRQQQQQQLVHHHHAPSLAGDNVSQYRTVIDVRPKQMMNIRLGKEVLSVPVTPNYELHPSQDTVSVKHSYWGANMGYNVKIPNRLRTRSTTSYTPRRPQFHM